MLCVQQLEVLGGMMVNEMEGQVSEMEEREVSVTMKGWVSEMEGWVVETEVSESEMEGLVKELVNMNETKNYKPLS